MALGRLELPCEDRVRGTQNELIPAFETRKVLVRISGLFAALSSLPPPSLSRHVCLSVCLFLALRRKATPGFHHRPNLGGVPQIAPLSPNKITRVNGRCPWAVATRRRRLELGGAAASGSSSPLSHRPSATWTCPSAPATAQRAPELRRPPPPSLRLSNPSNYLFNEGCPGSSEFKFSFFGQPWGAVRRRAVLVDRPDAPPRSIGCSM